MMKRLETMREGLKLPTRCLLELHEQTQRAAFIEARFYSQQHWVWHSLRIVIF